MRSIARPLLCKEHVLVLPDRVVFTWIWPNGRMDISAHALHPDNTYIIQKHSRLRVDPSVIKEKRKLTVKSKQQLAHAISEYLNVKFDNLKALSLKDLERLYAKI